MKTIKCGESWYKGKCRFSDEVKGWGCRLLTCIPDEVPISVREKADLFCKVYSLAKSSGITSCKYFCESDIDKALDNEEMLGQMVLLKLHLRADLLSEQFDKIYN